MARQGRFAGRTEDSQSWVLSRTESLRGSQVPFSSEKPCIKETAALLIPKKAQMREERLKGLAPC